MQPRAVQIQVPVQPAQIQVRELREQVQIQVPVHRVQALRAAQLMM